MLLKRSKTHYSHEQISHLTTGTFNLLSKTESAFRLSGAFQSNSLQLVKRVLETCWPSQSVKTREAEPFKSTAAVHNVSTKERLYFVYSADSG